MGAGHGDINLLFDGLPVLGSQLDGDLEYVLGPFSASLAIVQQRVDKAKHAAFLQRSN